MSGQYSLGDLSGVLGGDLYNNLFSTQGFSGINDGWSGSGPVWATEFGVNEGGNTSWLPTPNQDALSAFDGYSFNWTPTGGIGGTLSAYDPSGKEYGSFKQEDESGFTKLLDKVAPAAASFGFGGGLAGMFGGGATGGALGHGLAQGTMSSMQGGSFGKGALSGAISGGMGGLSKAGMSPASVIGVSNPTFSGMINRGVGSTLGALASGQSGGDALQSGITGAALSGINSLGSQGMNFIKSSFDSLLGDDGFDSLQGSGGDMSEMTDVSPNRYEEFLPTGETNPGYRYADIPSLNLETPQKTTASVDSSPFSNILSGLGKTVGNYALNNTGDLASMLYGFYNNRRQQKALESQLSSLQGLYGQNSPYAQNLRAQLGAKAAAQGKRFNIAGRETQLQAALADRYAQLQPTMMQLNQARGQLKNQNMNMLLQGANKMGAFKSLADLFRPQQDYNDLGLLEASR